jgi:hypothetical protein
MQGKAGEGFSFELFPDLGVHRLSAGSDDGFRYVNFVDKFFDKSICPREFVRDNALWTIDFLDDIAGIRRDLLI